MSGDPQPPKKPCIITPLPGPKASALIADDATLISPSYTRGYPFAIERGQGAMVQDVDGNWFLDFCAGIAVCNTGHSHPKVLQAIQAQAADFLHMSGTDFYYQGMVDLARVLDRVSPGETPKKVFFCNSGAEALEGSVKLARYHTQRPYVLSFYKSFHGRTYGAMSLSASKVVHRSHMSPFVGNVIHAHYPNAYRPFFGHQNPEAEAQACLDFIENVLFKTVLNPSELAAIVLEPIQGEGGYVVPPSNWLPGIRALCDKVGAMMVVDEVQSGIGRTGKMWAMDHSPVEPDIIASAKGLASGLPLGAIIAKADVMSWPPGAHATTFGGNPVACAAALATLDLVENGLMQSAHHVGEYLLAKLRDLQAKHPVIGDVRGQGLMVGMEMITDAQTKARNPGLRDYVVDAAFTHGLLILGCGENTIRFCPPLVVDTADVDTVIEILDLVLSARP